MAITSEQRKALEAAGYKISKSGNTVLNSKGESVGGYNENGNIWSGSSKVRDILKSKPAPKAESKPASKPSGKPATRPKANPTRKPGGARPEVEKPTGLPAAPARNVGGAKADQRRAGGSGNTTRRNQGAGIPILGVGAVVAGAGRKPATGRPVNPSYTGRAVMPEGFQGRMQTGVARPGAAGGARVIGTNPARRGLRSPGGGRVVKMPDVLELAQMNKGGMVKKPASSKPPRTYKK
jgi:hypothetical protein